MSKELAFIKSVLSLPEDRLRWLVYADWLAEQEDPRERWCRATAVWMEATADGDVKQIKRLSAAREKARRKLDPNWLAVLDTADAFTIMLPADLLTHFRRDGSDQLKELHSWASVQSDFHMAGVKPDALVYAIHLLKGDVSVVGRLRVRSISARTRPFTENEFLTATLRRGVELGLTRPGDIQVVKGSEGMILRDAVMLPTQVLERLRYVNRSGERGLSSLQGGKLKNSTTIQGVFRLARQSRLDLAWLLFRPGEIPPLFARAG